MKTTKYADRIRKIRNEKGFTQEYMGECLGISPNAYGNIENGKKNIEIQDLEKIAKIYNMNLFDLLHDETAIKIKQTDNDTSTGNVAVNQNDTLVLELIKAKDETITVLKSTLEMIKGFVSSK